MIKSNGYPEWNSAPEWAMWRAMDRDGSWYWYETQPLMNFFGSGTWGNKDARVFAGEIKPSHINPSWLETKSMHYYKVPNRTWTPSAVLSNRVPET